MIGRGPNGQAADAPRCHAFCKEEKQNARHFGLPLIYALALYGAYMWLYRVMSMSKTDGTGTFYDATASMKNAIRVAKIIQNRSPSHDVTVEGEHWSRLSWWRYKLHRIARTHDGFGVNFTDRHNLNIEEIRTVWSEGAERER